MALCCSEMIGGITLKKRVTVILEVESDDEINMDDRFIQNDIVQELSCASNRYEIVSIQTENAIDYINEHEPHELTKEEWEAWKKNSKRDPICAVWKDDYTPCWIFKPENIHEPAYLMGEIKLFSGKPDRRMIHWNEEDI